MKVRKTTKKHGPHSQACRIRCGCGRCRRKVVRLSIRVEMSGQNFMYQDFVVLKKTCQLPAKALDFDSNLGRHCLRLNVKNGIQLEERVLKLFKLVGND